MLRGHSQHAHSCWASFTLTYQMSHSMPASFCALGTRPACCLSWVKWHSVSRIVMWPLQWRWSRQNDILPTKPAVHQGRRQRWTMVAWTPIDHSSNYCTWTFDNTIYTRMAYYRSTAHELSVNIHELWFTWFMTCSWPSLCEAGGLTGIVESSALDVRSAVFHMPLVVIVMMDALFFLQTQEIKQADGCRWEELYSSEQHPQNLGWHMMAVVISAVKHGHDSKTWNSWSLKFSPIIYTVVHPYFSTF